jgi:hypothetical protein
MKQHLFVLILCSDSFVCSKRNDMVLCESAQSRFQFRKSVTLTDEKLTTNRGCATISDKETEYFFYTGELFCLQQNHTIIANGYGLLGNRSSTIGYHGYQSHKTHIFIIFFTVDRQMG